MNSMLFLIGSSLVVIAVIWILFTLWIKIKCRNNNKICIVVLGDLGRSPRMQYHVLSFIKEGYIVDVIGYPGSKPLEGLRTNAAVKIHYLTSLPEWHNQIPRLLSYVIKTLWQSCNLLWMLFININSTYLMLQNPPAIPTLPICWIYCCIFRMYFLIDWHNYAYSIMSITVGPENLLVKITAVVEKFFGARAHINFCVSNAMKKDLYERWNIEANVLYDRPPDEFRPIDLSEKHSLLLRLSETYEELGNGEKGSSVLTQCLSNGEIQLRSERPALIISSTSWTEDEDFSILLTALKNYESACCNDNINLPNLICVITGKGPLLNFWNAIIKMKQWEHIKIITPWLTNEDYPKLIASADLGICLHTSSSGLDLPMKVVDMYGCGLPVCAYNYRCINELVKHEENSLVFSNEEELANQLIARFTNFPNNDVQNMKDQKFRHQLETFQKLRWHANWLTVVSPCFK